MAFIFLGCKLLANYLLVLHKEEYVATTGTSGNH